MISLSLRGLLAGRGGGVLSGRVTDHMVQLSAFFFFLFLFLPLKSAALDFGLDMKRLDSFKLLSAQSGSALPDGFNKEPRTVASAADGPAAARASSLSILSNSQKRRAERIIYLLECFFFFNLYLLIVWCIVFLSLHCV